MNDTETTIEVIEIEKPRDFKIITTRIEKNEVTGELISIPTYEIVKEEELLQQLADAQAVVDKIQVKIDAVKAIK